MGITASYGIRNGQRIYEGYNDERKVKGRKDKILKRSPGTNGAAVQPNNPLPAKYEDSIVCGDSLEVLQSLPDNCIDMAITSPPYNFGLDYEGYEDTVQWERYFEQLIAIFAETARVLKYGGRLAVNVQPLFSDYKPTHHLISTALMDLGLLWKGEILWEKNNYNCKYTAWGSWKSPSSPYLKYTWEFVEVFCKGAYKHAGRSDDADISADEFKKWVYAKWSIAPERSMKEYGHPAMFPEQLVGRLLKLFSFRGDVVLDMFNGAGTTTAVAQRLGRRYLGIDVSQEYCDTAIQRISQASLPL